MDLGTFETSPTGSLVPIEVVERGEVVKHAAFVPNELPASLNLSPTTWAQAMSAVEMMGRLDAITAELDIDPVLLSKPTVRREAVSTSALEGTFAPAEEVLKSELDVHLPRTPAVQEILNYIDATNHGVRRITELPIGTKLAKELQDILIRGTASDDYQRGKLRKTQVIIGPYKGCSVKDATYVPPPPGKELRDGVSAWERWVNEESELHIVVRIALAHYQFEALHPFTDGNGRIGRLIAILQLIDARVLTGPILNLSPHFERKSDEYRYRLREVSISGDWNGWVAFFCEALAEQASEAIDRVHALLTWRSKTIETLRSSNHKGLILEIVEGLVSQPTLNVTSVVSSSGKTTAAANTAVNRLVDAGVLVEVTGGKYNRIFQAEDVIRILFNAP